MTPTRLFPELLVERRVSSYLLMGDHRVLGHDALPSSLTACLQL